jgi:general secretion pathway protein G
MRWLRDVLLVIVVEVLVVSPGVACAGVIGGMHCPKSDRVQLDLLAITRGISQYQLRWGHVPGNGFDDLIADGIMEKLPIDPWDRPYIYARRTDALYLATLGRDGTRGGTDSDTDLECWISTGRPLSPDQRSCWH